jgi:hypothetical protein
MERRDFIKATSGLCLSGLIVPDVMGDTKTPVSNTSEGATCFACSPIIGPLAMAQSQMLRNSEGYSEAGPVPNDISNMFRNYRNKWTRCQSWSFLTAPGDTIKEKYESLNTLVNLNLALRSDKRGSFIICAPEIASIFETCVRDFSKHNPIYSKINSAVTYVGEFEFAQKIDLIKDALFPTNEIIIISKTKPRKIDLIRLEDFVI